MALRHPRAVRRRPKFLIFNDGSEAEVVWCGSMAGPHGVRGELLPAYDRGSSFSMIPWTRDERTKDPDECRSYYNPNRGALWRAGVSSGVRPSSRSRPLSRRTLKTARPDDRLGVKPAV
jgi:hypothetical protein